MQKKEKRKEQKVRHWKLTAQVNKKVIHPSSTAIYSFLEKLIEQFRISWNWKESCTICTTMEKWCYICILHCSICTKSCSLVSSRPSVLREANERHRGVSRLYAFGLLFLVYGRCFKLCKPPTLLSLAAVQFPKSTAHLLSLLDLPRSPAPFCG